jgi:ornithine cyclodeaminase/alanine dehydrogenase-like protein (mu-crystallin family)
MPILILNQSQVEQELPMAECIDVVAEALAALARGEVYQPLRKSIVPPNAAGLMATMPAYRAGNRSAYGLKAICVFPSNPERGLDSHQGGVMLFSADTGELLALMNASAITAIRTAAASGVATRLLAREDAGDLAIIGSGVQARTHIEAMACVRGIKRARVASKRFEHAQRFAREMAPRFSFPIEVVKDAEQAVREADIIVTATPAADPIVRREWIQPGAHINAVGSSIPDRREIDSATMAASRLFVDRRESALNEAGDYLLACSEGAIGPDHILGEIGELLTGQCTGRRGDDDITIFKSLGIAIEDLAAADYLYLKAKKAGTGTWIDF